jgi:hypothetical protein
MEYGRGLSMLKSEYLKCMIFGLILCLFILTSSTVSGVKQRAFFESGITFGFQWDGVLFGDAEFIDPDYASYNDESLRQYLHEVTPIGTVTGSYDYVDLSKEYIDEKLKDSIGDTVMIIYSGGHIYAIIDKIIYFYDGPGCYQDVECVLSPVRSDEIDTGTLQDFVILRKDKFYGDSIIPYREYLISGPSYEAIVDSVIIDMANAAMDYENGKLRRINNMGESQFLKFWLEDRQDPTCPFPFIAIESKVYGIKSFDMPDTLFLVISATVESNSSFLWTSLLEIYKEGNSWHSIGVLEPHPGWWFRFICSFDLNEDGIREYFVFSWDGALYTCIGGKFELVAYADYRGC